MSIVRAVNGDGPRCDHCRSRSALRVIEGGSLDERGIYLCARCTWRAVRLFLSTDQEKASGEAVA